MKNIGNKKLKSIDIINVLSDLVSEKLETTVKLPIKHIGKIGKIKKYPKKYDIFA